MYAMSMTNTTQAEAPNYIARDAYEGRHSIHRPNGKVKAGTFLAIEIAEMASEGVIWESFGATFPGRESFGRSRYIADADGNLHVYDSNGRKIIVHPARRRLRLLTK